MGHYEEVIPPVNADLNEALAEERPFVAIETITVTDTSLTATVRLG